MDFFATGGFQQLFNDLNEPDLSTEFSSELYAATSPVTTLDSSHDLVEYQLTQTDEQYSFNFIPETDADADPFVRVQVTTLPDLLELHGNVSIISLLDCNTNNNNTSDFNMSHTDGPCITLAFDELAVQQSLDRLLEDNDLHSPVSCDSVTVADQLYNNAFDELETAAFITREMAEWEEKFLDNYIEIPELVDFLPEKTPLCTETCEHFLKESTKNLRLHRKTTTKRHAERDCEKLNYPCTFGECAKIYAKPAHLKAHMRRHLGEKPYICTWPDCTWKFSRSDELARHRRSHSGVKPYKCDYCMKCFARSDHLTKHRKVHERRLLAASKAGKTFDGEIPHSVFTVRPGRKRKNQIC